MNTDVMFSKASDEWSTPQDFFEALDAEFQFDIDAAASAENAKCAVWYGGRIDALNLKSWGSRPCSVWLNPPYSQCSEFLAKAATEANKGHTVVCLVPSRTDTRWWHRLVWHTHEHRPYQGVEVRFVKGRLKFGNSNNSAPFPSAVVIFRPVESGVGAPCGGRVSRVSDDGGRA